MDTEMTSQKKKAVLRKYRDAERKAERIEQEIARWYSKAEKMTTVIKMVPGGGGCGRSTETAVDEIIELKDELAEQYREEVRLRRAIGAAIEAVDDEKSQQVLRLKYIDGLTWEEVAEVMDMSPRGATKAHGRALARIDVSSL